MAEPQSNNHHPFGPSRWPALLECPYWQGKPGGADAQRGTRLHELFALGIDAAAPTPADAFERNAIALGERLRGMAPQGVEIKTEQRVVLSVPYDLPDLGIFGRYDAAWYDAGKRTYHVADLKMVHNPDRDYRPQLLAYAMAWPPELNVARFALHFCYVETGEIVTEEIEAGAAAAEYRELYRRIAELATGGTAYAAKQSGWCQLCAGHESCPAPREVAESVTAGKLAGAPDRWPTFSSEQKARLCVLADAVAKWADAIKKRAGDDAKGGAAIEDPEHGIYYGLQARAGKLQVSTEDAWAVCRQHLTPEGFKPCLDVSVTRLTAALKAAGMAAKDAKALVEGAGTRGPSSWAFVRKADKGGAA